MGLVGKTFGSIATTLSEEDADSQSGSTTGNVHGCSSGEIETTQDE